MTGRSAPTGGVLYVPRGVPYTTGGVPQLAGGVRHVARRMSHEPGGMMQIPRGVVYVPRGMSPVATAVGPAGFAMRQGLGGVMSLGSEMSPVGRGMTHRGLYTSHVAGAELYFPAPVVSFVSFVSFVSPGVYETGAAVPPLSCRPGYTSESCLPVCPAPPCRLGCAGWTSCLPGKPGCSGSAAALGLERRAG
jgi:hypothetical protein